jgi:hypothetical protein
MSERDEIVRVIDGRLDRGPPVASGVFDSLRHLFAEKPWLANALLPELHHVCWWFPDDTWGELHEVAAPKPKPLTQEG